MLNNNGRLIEREEEASKTLDPSVNGGGCALIGSRRHLNPFRLPQLQLRIRTDGQRVHVAPSRSAALLTGPARAIAAFHSHPDRLKR